MPKPIIAVDIDDVLANSTDALRLEVNKRVAVQLQPEHYAVPGPYSGYYARVWQEHGIDISLDELGPQMRADQTHVAPHDGAVVALRQLAEHYRLVVVTARNVRWKQATQAWLDMRFPGVFSDVIFTMNEDGVQRTKGETCAEIGAHYLIDDLIEHCEAAMEQGITAILFGNYGWHQEVPKTLVRCKDWPAVQEYFKQEERNA